MAEFITVHEPGDKIYTMVNGVVFIHTVSNNGMVQVDSDN